MQPENSFLASPVFSVEHARSSACFARPFEMIRLRNVRAAACDAYWSGYIIGLTWNVRSDDPIDASKILIRSFFVASLDASSIVLDEDEDDGHLRNMLNYLYVQLEFCQYYSRATWVANKSQVHKSSSHTQTAAHAIVGTGRATGWTKRCHSKFMEPDAVAGRKIHSATDTMNWEPLLLADNDFIT